jgi:hypothetical protein
VLHDELRKGHGPALLGRANDSRPAMPFEGRDGSRASELETAIALAEMAFIVFRVGQAGPNQVAGAAAGQNTGYRRGLRVDRFENLLVGIRSEVGGQPSREHGPHLTERERAGCIEEVAHLGGLAGCGCRL